MERGKARFVSQIRQEALELTALRYSSEAAYMCLKTSSLDFEHIEEGKNSSNSITPSVKQEPRGESQPLIASASLP